MKEARRWLSCCVAINSSDLFSFFVLFFFFGDGEGGRNKHLKPLMQIPGLSVHQADHLACHLCGNRLMGNNR